MTVTNAAEFRRNLSAYLKQASQEQEAIRVDTDDGGVIIMGAGEYRNMMETISLLRVPGMREKLTAGMKTPIEECDDFEW